MIHIEKIIADEELDGEMPIAVGRCAPNALQCCCPVWSTATVPSMSTREEAEAQTRCPALAARSLHLASCWEVPTLPAVPPPQALAIA